MTGLKLHVILLIVGFHFVVYNSSFCSISLDEACSVKHGGSISVCMHVVSIQMARKTAYNILVIMDGP